MFFKKTTNIFILLLTVLIFLSVSCDKDPNGPDIPEAFIDIYLRPNDLDFIADGGWVYVTAQEPSRGIIVYRLFHDQFMAYERTCPYDPYACCEGASTYLCSRLQVEADGVTIIDTCCNSKYMILDGAPIEGPSPWVLKQYGTEYNGDVLHIYN
jgi:nitrite reductase/ring-hydroxylating ferredoxin subunit